MNILTRKVLKEFTDACISSGKYVETGLNLSRPIQLQIEDILSRYNDTTAKTKINKVVKSSISEIEQSIAIAISWWESLSHLDRILAEQNVFGGDYDYGVKIYPHTSQDIVRMYLTSIKSINTSYVYPPIPNRNYDWEAVREDYDGCDNDLIGYGKTEQDSINDLIEQELDQ